MENPKTLATLDNWTQDDDKHNTTQQPKMSNQDPTKIGSEYRYSS